MPSVPNLDCIFRSILRFLRPHLHLAIPLRPALAVVLRAALHRHRVVRHVLGDDRARTDIGAVADLHRRHQRGVGADEGALADRGLVLEEAVVVAGDGAGAEIGVGADMGVADIGEMVDLGARLDRRGLGLDEIADPDAVAERGAGAQARIGADGAPSCRSRPARCARTNGSPRRRRW